MPRTVSIDTSPWNHIIYPTPFWFRWSVGTGALLQGLVSLGACCVDATLGARCVASAQCCLDDCGTYAQAVFCSAFVASTGGASPGVPVSCSTISPPLVVRPYFCYVAPTARGRKEGENLPRGQRTAKNPAVEATKKAELYTPKNDV